jgi:hypothetical protein
MDLAESSLMINGGDADEGHKPHAYSPAASLNAAISILEGQVGSTLPVVILQIVWLTREPCEFQHSSLSSKDERA